MRFQGTIERSGKTATGIPVPEDVLRRLGGARKPAVRVVLNEFFEYRTTVGPIAGRATGHRLATARPHRSMPTPMAGAW